MNAVRAEREANTLFLDGGDTWHGSWSALQTGGEDMVRCMNVLQPDAMVGHWEFTYGADRVEELIEQLAFPFLAANIIDNEWEEPVFESTLYVERGGVKVAVIGQAFPYTPIANPRWMIPSWSFGVRDDVIRDKVQEARDEGAGLVVLLSHNGFDVDHKVAENVDGIDVILTGHTHDAMPEPLVVNKTLVVGTGSNGKFVSRLDLDVGSDGVKDFSFKLMPVFSDAIEPDAEVAALIDEVRAPYEEHLSEVVAQAESTLYRRGNFNGTFDDVICAAMLEQRDAQIALSPGFRWGTSLPAGAEVTRDFVYSHTAMTYPNVYRLEFTGQMMKDIMEDVADNLFNVDPYYQQGGDMVRVGGMGYDIDVNAAMGARISNLHLTATGEPLEADKSYVVAGWASVNEGTEGPPVWDVVFAHLEGHRELRVEENQNVRVKV